MLHNLSLLLKLFFYYCVCVDKGSSLPSVLSVETEREKKLAQHLRDFKLRSAPLWKQEMKNRQSKICGYFVSRRLSVTVNNIIQAYINCTHVFLSLS